MQCPFECCDLCYSSGLHMAQEDVWREYIDAVIIWCFLICIYCYSQYNNIKINNRNQERCNIYIKCYEDIVVSDRFRIGIGSQQNVRWRVLIGILFSKGMFLFSTAACSSFFFIVSRPKWRINVFYREHVIHYIFVDIASGDDVSDDVDGLRISYIYRWQARQGH